MQTISQAKPKVRLATIIAGLAIVVWVIGAIVLLIMYRQQDQIERDAQHIYDVSMSMVFDATRAIRGVERLAREGEAILWIEDATERKRRRVNLDSLRGDAALQGNQELRDLIVRSFATLDTNLTDLSAHGVRVRAEALARWEPVMSALQLQSEAIGANVSGLAMNEADRILQSTDAARKTMLLNAALVAGVSVLLFAFLYIAFARPVARIASLLERVRRGARLRDGKEVIHEMQMLYDAAVALSRAHTELETTRIKLQELAHTDPLTGLANRRMFEHNGAQAFANGRRHKEDISIIVFDIDHFKDVNDRYGHEGGDSVLRALGAYLLTAVRDADRPPARMGGEEFAMLLPHASLEIAHVAAERLRTGIEMLEVTMPNGEVLHFTVSVGVAQRVEEDADLHSLMHRADLALYRAKEGGRNQVALAS